MILNVRHSGIVVRDLKKSLDFYKYLGFKVVSDEMESGNFIDRILGFDDCKIHTIKMVCDGEQMIELLKYENPVSDDFTKVVNSIGCSHLALTVNDIKSLYDDLIGKDVEFINPPASNGKVMVAFCKDPNDVWLELVEEL